MPEDRRNRADIILDKLESGELDYKDAASDLIDAYFPVLLSYARKFSGVDEREAEEYVNPALLHALRHLLEFKAPKTFPVVMLMHLRRVMRAAKPELTGPLDDDMLKVERSETGQAGGATVRSVMEKVLSAEESQLLLLQHMEGKSFAEIAEVRNESPGEVERRLTLINLRFAEEARLLDAARSGRDAAR
jgi:RNA polymerase sigma factor (sigma-70 family)